MYHLHCFQFDGVDATFTQPEHPSKSIAPSDPLEKSETGDINDQCSAAQLESGDNIIASRVFFPVKKDEFSQLGTNAQLQVAIALTNHEPDSHDFDNFPNPSQKEIKAAKAKAEAEARAIEEQRLKEEAALIEAQKPKVKSTTKVEQVSTISNEVIHVWASAEDAAAVMVRYCTF